MYNNTIFLLVTFVFINLYANDSKPLNFRTQYYSEEELLKTPIREIKYGTFLETFDRLTPQQINVTWGVDYESNIDSSHPTYFNYQKILLKAFNDFKLYKPELVGNSSAPTLIIFIWDKSQNAFVDKVPYFMAKEDAVEQQNVIYYYIDKNSPKSESSIYITFLHELTHVFLRHDSDNTEKEPVYIKKSNFNNGEFFEISQKESEIIKKYGKIDFEYNDNLKYSELNDIPIWKNNGDAGNLLYKLIRSDQINTSIDCRITMVRKYISIHSFVMPKYSSLTYSFKDLNSMESKKLSELVSDFYKDTEECSSTGLRVNFRQLAGLFKDIDLSQYSDERNSESAKNSGLEPLSSFLKDNHPIIALLKFYKNKMSKLKSNNKLFEKVDLNNIIKYSVEVEADLLVSEILKQVKFDIKNIESHFLIDRLTEDEKTQCKSYESFEELPFGHLNSSHPSACWRYHLIKNVIQQH